MARKRCRGCPSRSGPPFFATSERRWLGFTRSTLAILQKTWCRRDEKTDHRQAGLLPRPSLESASEAILSAVRRVSCEIRPAVVHRDLYLPNTLVAAGRFRCLLDFEHARSTDPLSDFVKLAMWVFETFPGSESEFRSGHGSDPCMTKGAGLPRATSTPDTTTSKRGRTPSVASVVSMTSGPDDDARPRRRPRATSVRSTSGTPGSGVTRSRRSGNTRAV